MSYSLLGIIQQAANEMGLPAPTFISGNTAADTVQMLALLNGLGDELRREFPWQSLEKEYRFNTAFLATTGNVTNGSAIVTGIPSTATLTTSYMSSGAGIQQDTYIQSVDSANQVTLSQAVQTTATGESITFGKTKYALPSDFDRIIDRTQYDKSKRWALMGPSSPQEWQFLKSSYIATGPRLRFRILGNQLQLWPMMSTAEYIGFEYVSNGWVTSNGASVQAFAQDADTCIFPDRMMVVGLKKKYFEVKGFNAQVFQIEFEHQLNIAKSEDQGSSTLSFAPRMSAVLVGYENIPDSGYGT